MKEDFFKLMQYNGFPETRRSLQRKNQPTVDVSWLQAVSPGRVVMPAFSAKNFQKKPAKHMTGGILANMDKQETRRRRRNQREVTRRHIERSMSSSVEGDLDRFDV